MHPVEKQMKVIAASLRLFLIPLLLVASLAVTPGPARAADVVGLDLTGGGNDTMAAGETVSAPATDIGNAFGSKLDNSAELDNSGTISATSESWNAYGVYSFGSSTLTNSGTISASGGAGSYAIFGRGTSTVNLETGTQILSGSVYSETSSTLNVTSNSDLDFVLAGIWNTIQASGTGAWTLGSGSSASANTLTLDLGSIMVMPTDSRLTVTGTATLNGTLLVAPSSDALGTTTILTAGTLNTGPAYRTGNANPNFRVNATT